MLDLRRDLYARLVISAHKNKPLNKPFRVKHSSSWSKYSLGTKDDRTDFEKKVSDNTLTSSSSTFSNPASINKSTLKPIATQKIEDKINNIIADPKLAEIKMDLEIAEGLLKKIKSVDEHNAKIPVLEQNIYRLKMMLDQKIYVY